VYNDKDIDDYDGDDSHISNLIIGVIMWILAISLGILQSNNSYYLFNYSLKITFNNYYLFLFQLIK
jgi:hypothetical protein